MSKKKSKYNKLDKDYINVLGTYVTIILIIIMGVGILGALAFPYYLSPIARAQGYSNINSSLIYFIPSLISVLLILWGVIIMEGKETGIGLGIIIFGIFILLLIVWSLNGISSVKVLFNIS
jgi:uncharacterized Tic20 family protein